MENIVTKINMLKDIFETLSSLTGAAYPTNADIDDSGADFFLQKRDNEGGKDSGSMWQNFDLILQGTDQDNLETRLDIFLNYDSSDGSNRYNKTYNAGANSFAAGYPFKLTITDITDEIDSESFGEDEFKLNLLVKAEWSVNE